MKVKELIKSKFETLNELAYKYKHDDFSKGIPEEVKEMFSNEIFEDYIEPEKAIKTMLNKCEHRLTIPFDETRLLYDNLICDEKATETDLEYIKFTKKEIEACEDYEEFKNDMQEYERVYYKYITIYANEVDADL